jgi:uncharacterized protein YjiS (DUF1127 family)
MNGFAPTCPDDGPGHRPLLSALASGIVRAVLWPSRVVEARRTLSQLAGLSEYELRDIGLSRQDLVDFTARPLDEDPTPHLADSRATRARMARVHSVHG